MPKTDIVLISFPFTDLSGNKIRPALILAESALDVTVCFITSQTQFVLPTDILLQPDKNNGIKKISIIRVSKIATIDRSLVKGKIGFLDTNSKSLVENNLKEIFQIS